MTLDSEILNQAIKLTTLGMGIVFGLLIVFGLSIL